MSSIVQELIQNWGAFSAELESSTKVLVVDDEPNVLKLLGALLAGEEFSCRFAASGEEALAAFEQERADILVTDKNLPGIDGVELIRRIRQADEECEAIMITGYANLESALIGMDLGVADYLTKPLPHIGIVSATVKKAARRRNGRAFVHRMVADLKEAVNLRAAEEDAALIADARQRWEQFREKLSRRRCVMFADQVVADVRPAARHLAESGFDVPIVKTGAKTLELCRKSQADVVVAGDNLDDMTGLMLFEQLTEIPAHPEVILASETTGLQDVITAIATGASGYVLKPITDLEVFARLVERAHLEHRQRLTQLKLVEVLRGLLETIGEREVGEGARRGIESALESFGEAASQGALKAYEERSDEPLGDGGG